MKFLAFSILIVFLFIGSNSQAQAQKFNLFYEVESGVSHLTFMQKKSRIDENDVRTSNYYKNEGYRFYYTPNFKINVGLTGIKIFKHPTILKTSVERFSQGYGFTNEIVDNRSNENYYIFGLGMESNLTLSKNWESTWGIYGHYIFRRDAYYYSFKENVEFPIKASDYEHYQYRKLLPFIETGIFYKNLKGILKPGIRLRTSVVNLNPREPEFRSFIRGYLSSINLVLQLGDFR